MREAHTPIWMVIGGTALLFALFIAASMLAFDVTYDYTLVTVATGGAVLGLVSGVLGSFAVLRRESLMGDALSHAALPGIAIAFLIAGRELGWLLIGAGVASWLGVMFINAVLQTTRIKQDTAMGMTLAAFFAFGVALLSYIQGRADASQAGLDQFIFGQAAAMVRSDVLGISGVGLVAFLILALLWKEFKLITFDMEFAGANGFPVRILDVLLSTMIVVAIVLGLQLAGVVLMVGLLIAPAVAARQWTSRLESMIFLAAAFGAFAGASGAIVSGIEAGLPTGPLIIVVAFIIVAISITLAPERGLLWSFYQQSRVKRRFAAQNVLRDLYRHALEHGDARRAAPEGFLTAMRGRSARVGLRQLEGRGLVARTGSDSWMLTDAGITHAEADAHNQQLWGAYRLHAEALHLPNVAEDHQEDIHAVLPDDAVAKLELTLKGT